MCISPQRCRWQYLRNNIANIHSNLETTPRMTYVAAHACHHGEPFDSTVTVFISACISRAYRDHYRSLLTLLLRERREAFEKEISKSAEPLSKYHHTGIKCFSSTDKANYKPHYSLSKCLMIKYICHFKKCDKCGTFCMCRLFVVQRSPRFFSHSQQFWQKNITNEKLLALSGQFSIIKVYKTFFPTSPQSFYLYRFK